MNQIAKTILEQLGGNKFVVMTGANRFEAYDNGLGFKIGKNGSGANWIKVVLTPADEYNMEFYRFDVRTGMTLIYEYKGIYFDQLQELFTEYTGMYTSLS